MGPNVGTIAGAALGALVGLLRRQRPDPRHARAAEASGAIVLAVATRGEHEASLLGGLLRAQGVGISRRTARGAHVRHRRRAAAPVREAVGRPSGRPRSFASSPRPHVGAEARAGLSAPRRVRGPATPRPLGAAVRTGGR